MKKVLLITGPGGDAQGWGNLKVTQDLCDNLNHGTLAAEVAYVETLKDLVRALETGSFDIAWSALYHISPREDIIGIGGDVEWIADILDERRIPYIGPSSRTMKILIQKYETHRILGQNGVPVPVHHLVTPGKPMPAVPFPAFVKPNCESRSIGISDESVVKDPEQLSSRVRYVHREFKQDALIEEFLPGEEYTVLMIGNGRFQEILPGKVTVEEKYYGKHRILRSDLRGVGLTKISIPETRSEEAESLGRRATDALECLDHVRVDMRVGSDGRLKIIEVNGIPGLKPVKSWSPQIYSLYHPSGKGPMEEYRDMVHLIVRSALERHGLH